jgi:hypothetical protein
MSQIDSSGSQRALSKKQIWIALITGTFAVLFGFVFFGLETRYSLPMILWHHRFEHALSENGQVNLGALVDFKWDRIYFMGAYDPEHPEDYNRLFSIRSPFDPFWWQNYQRYWTIAYTRPGLPSFLIRMDSAEWVRRRGGRFWSEDSNVKLRVVAPGTVEATWCPSFAGVGRCLAVDDVNAKIPTEPNH